jgi:hypothetical protein
LEAQASAAASSDAVAELTAQLEASRRQVANVQADATAELGAAQACLQLLRLKQQRLLLAG